MLTVTNFDELKPTTLSVIVKFAKRIDLSIAHTQLISNENIVIIMDPNPYFCHSIKIGVKRDSKIYPIRLSRLSAIIKPIESIEKATEIIDYLNSLISVSEGKEEEEYIQIK